MTPHRHMLNLAVALAACGLPLGCGGEGDGAGAGSGDGAPVDGPTDAGGSAGGEGQTATKADFIAASNEVCAKSKRRMTAEIGLRVRAGAEEKAEPEALVEEVIGPGFEKQIRDIRALGPPPEGSREVDRMLRALQATLDEARAKPAAIAYGERSFAKSERLAKAYGIPECGGL